MSSGYKYLIKNIGILTVSNFATKILVFFLVPLYTVVLSTEEYGNYDLINTTIGLIIPIFTLNILEGEFRYAMDKESDNKNIFTVAVKFFIISLIPVSLLLWLNHIFYLIPVFDDFAVFFFIMYVLNALHGIITYMARGLDKILVVSVAGVIGSLVIIISNILFLLVFKFGLNGYFEANILGILVQCIYIFFTAGLWHYVTFPFKDNINLKQVQKKMLCYSVPMIANSIAWWVNNVSDRYIVTWICGVAENGIYSIGYKIPNILNIFQSIFAQAWTLSAVKEFDPYDKDGFFARLYAMYNCCMVLVCSLIIVSDRILAKLLYSRDFYIAWKYVPFLTIAIVFGSLSGYIGGIFSAVKKSNIFAESTVIGAISNILINIILIKQIGALGAAVSTAVAYCIVWIFRYYHMKKLIKIKINIIRDIIAYIILFLQSIMLILMKENIFIYIVQIIFFIILTGIFFNDLRAIVWFINNQMKGKNQNG